MSASNLGSALESGFTSAEESNSEYYTMSESEEEIAVDQNGSNDTIELSIEFNRENGKLTTRHDRKPYVIYFLDLYQLEYDRLLDLCNGLRSQALLTVFRDHIYISVGQLSVRRIREPENRLPADLLMESKLSGTECIAFASFEKNFLAKCKGKYYLVQKPLMTEYKDVLARSGYPMGTSMRLRRNRLMVDDKEHILSIKKRPNEFHIDQEIVVIEAFAMATATWIAAVENCQRSNLGELKRYIKFAEKEGLRRIPIGLIFCCNEGECDELYSETDFDNSNNSNNSKSPKNRIAAYRNIAQTDSDSESSTEEDFYSGKQKLQKFQKVGTIRPRNPRIKHRVPSNHQKLFLSPLQTYPVCSYLKELMRTNFRVKSKAHVHPQATALLQEIIQLKSLPKVNRLNANNYNRIFSLTLQMEDEYVRREMLTYSQKDAKVTKVRNPFPEVVEAYCINLNIAGGDAYEMFEEAITDRKIYYLNVQVMKDSYRNDDEYALMMETAKNCFEPNAKVLKIDADDLYFQTYEPLNLKRGNLFFVQFMHNPTTYQLNRQSLDYVERHSLYNILLPKGPFAKDVAPEKDEINWIQTDLNTEQKKAVRNIINNTSYPYPYILFGPPGTGKTKTLVEAIAQIITTTNDNILLCAPSNLACDVLTAMLMKQIPSENIYRLYSKLANPYNMSQEIRSISNFLDVDHIDDHFYPSLSFLTKFPVLVCTLSVAGRLCQAKIGRNHPQHFSYVFIDECASAAEFSALLPVAGVCSVENAITAHVVLSGDPKQLGPVVRCHMAMQLGLGVSLIERLMNQEPYLRNAYTKQFNNRYILQLTLNYRSHEAILKFSNDNFYDGTMVPKAYRSVVTTFINTEILPSPKYPIIFKSVQGLCGRYNKLSFFNTTEMDVVVSYAEQLINGVILPSYQHNQTNGQKKKIKPVKMEDIGIISTYRGQCRGILKKCRDRGWDDLKVGTVNLFQGEEKPIIIVSTVRSGGQGVGFLGDWKRLNVLMTRAKCLLIIVGDPFTLQQDPYWKKLLLELQTKNAIIQSDERFTIRKA